MSLFTAFDITLIQTARKKNEKKRKATMVIKLVRSVRVLLKTFCSLYYDHFIIFRVLVFGSIFCRSSIYGRPHHYYHFTSITST